MSGWPLLPVGYVVVGLYVWKRVAWWMLSTQTGNDLAIRQGEMNRIEGDDIGFSFFVAALCAVVWPVTLLVIATLRGYHYLSLHVTGHPILFLAPRKERNKLINGWVEHDEQIRKRREEIEKLGGRVVRSATIPHTPGSPLHTTVTIHEHPPVR